MNTILDFPVSVRKRLVEEDVIQDLVLVNLLERLANAEALEEYREDAKFSVQYHKDHKKIDGVISRGCGCDYCKALNRYSLLTLEAHRIRRKIDDYHYGHLYDTIDERRRLKQLEDETREARIKKNKLKEKLKVNLLY